VTNRGDIRWPGGQHRPLIRATYRLFRPNGSAVVAEGYRTDLPGPFPPGHTATVPLLVAAPDVPGQYRLQVDLVHEHVRWFDAPVEATMTVPGRSQRTKKVGSHSLMRVALTFDAEHAARVCTDGSCERILDLLRDARIRATFFVQGRWAFAYPTLARRIGDERHLVGSHSHHHARTSFFTADGLRNDLVMARDAVRNSTGCDPYPWFRLPFGEGADDDRVRATLDEEGWRHIGWNIDPSDWHPDTTSELMLDRIITQADAAEARGDTTAVVLMHSWPTPTPIALPDVIDEFRTRRVEFITVDMVSPH
jgi:peptidoglycan/xylan/chitin deacetylase (PgdA/CDA1 family)